MNMKMNRLIVAAALLAATLVARADDEPQYLKNAEITIDPPEKHLQVVTVRLLPGVTRNYTMLSFDCIYRQEYPWTNSAGRVLKRVTEPIHFTYERPNVKLTDDLDAYVSFKMPIGTEMLRERFGKTTFRENVPVTVPRIRVVARDEFAQVWVYELPTTAGLQLLTSANRPDLKKPEERVKPKPRSQRTKLGAIDLD